MNTLDNVDSKKAIAVIDACIEACKYCTQTAAYLTYKGGSWAEPHRLQLLYDCADINHTVSNFVSRASRFHTSLAAFAADVSDACAETLGLLEHEDAQIRATYAACLSAARECRELCGQEEPAAYEARDEKIWESFPGSDAPPSPTNI